MSILEINLGFIFRPLGILCRDLNFELKVPRDLNSSQNTRPEAGNAAHLSRLRLVRGGLRPP